MGMPIGSKIEVYTLDELPPTAPELKFFACIGGTKNYECFLESTALSRADFMRKYHSRLDCCHNPIYEDEDLIITQDAQIPIPGFYIVATKKHYRKLCEMDLPTYQKCLHYIALLRTILKESFGIDRAFMYYDEHYNKPSSTHFWIMPIYDEVIQKYHLDPTILKWDVWKYQEVFEFQYMKEKIYQMNEVTQKLLKERR